MVSYKKIKIRRKFRSKLELDYFNLLLCTKKIMNIEYNARSTNSEFRSLLGFSESFQVWKTS